MSSPIDLMQRLHAMAESESHKVRSSRQAAESLRRVAQEILFFGWRPATGVDEVLVLAEKLEELNDRAIGQMSQRLPIEEDSDEGSVVSVGHSSRGRDSMKDALCKMITIEQRVAKAIRRPEFQPLLARLGERIEECNEEETEDNADDLQLFVSQCCTLESWALVASADIYDAYVAWCANNGMRPVKRNEMGMWLRGAGFTAWRSNSKRFWRGLALK